MTAKGDIARRWFTDGWAGNLSLADQIFSTELITNGILVGPAGPQRNVANRLIGFPDLQSTIEDLIVPEDQVIVRVRWQGTHRGTYSGLPATGKQVAVQTIAIWRFVAAKVTEIWSVSDQFGVFHQLGAIPSSLWGTQMPAEQETTAP